MMTLTTTATAPLEPRHLEPWKENTLPHYPRVVNGPLIPGRTVGMCKVRVGEGDDRRGVLFIDVTEHGFNHVLNSPDIPRHLKQYVGNVADSYNTDARYLYVQGVVVQNPWDDEPWVTPVGWVDATWEVVHPR
jgi:hypothetical protein